MDDLWIRIMDTPSEPIVTERPTTEEEALKCEAQARFYRVMVKSALEIARSKRIRGVSADEEYLMAIRYAATAAKYEAEAEYHRGKLFLTAMNRAAEISLNVAMED